jgi:putative transposase
MIKTHKIRLNPASPQETYFYRASGVARFAWNWVLEEYKRRKASGQEIDWNEIKKEFRAGMETEFPFEVTKCAAEAAIADLRQAINIEMEGVRLLAGSGYIGVTTVEFAASGLKLDSI